MKKSIKVRDGTSKLEGMKNMILTIGKKVIKLQRKKMSRKDRIQNESKESDASLNNL